MLPEDLENFGQSLVATVFFANNVLIYLTSGYWVMEVDFKPLVHTWSLGVEEQYYFIAPVLMLGALRFGKKSLVFGMLLIFVGSLALCQVMAHEAPTFNFLMIFTRAWELVAGALVALYFRSTYQALLSSRMNNCLAWAGSLLLLVSFAFFDRHTMHPSLLTMFPIVGTALILMCANSQNLVGRMLSGRAMVLIGLVSYSLYLWHQPIFAFARLVSLDEPSVMEMLLLSLLSLVLAFLTWKYIEAPFRKKDAISLKITILLFGAISLVLAGTGAYWYSVSGFSQSTPEVSIDTGAQSIGYQAYNQSVMRFKQSVFNEDNGKGNVLVIGNSFARDFINCGLSNEYFSEHNLAYRLAIVDFSESSLALLPKCVPLVEQADYIIFASGYDKERAIETMQTISKIREITTAQVIVLGNKNFGWNNNAVMLLSKDQRYNYRTKVLPGILRREQEALKVIPESLYVSIFDVLIDVDGRVPVFTPERKFISQDRRHFTQHGAQYVGQLLFEHPLLLPLK
jgi:peptidoglycan/LPS O-acetylase OafA/YrhL